MRTKVALVTALLLAVPLAASAARPNILFILTDDQGYGAASSTQRRHRDAIAEAQHRLNLEARFKKFDKNGDGQLTREEFVIPDP